MGLAVASGVYAQSPWDTVWMYTEHYTNWDRLRKLAIDSQGNIVITGESDATTYNYNVLVIKLDSSGALQWSRMFNGPFDDTDQGLSVAVDSTGNYVVVGATASFSLSTSMDIWVMRFDATTGDTLWSRVIEWSEWDSPLDILTLPDGMLAITGYTYSFNDYTSEVFLIKMDPYGGDTTLVVIYPGPGYWEKGRAIAFDGSGYLLIGGDIRDSNYAYDGLLMKVDTSGNLIWQTYPGGTGNDFIRDVMVDVDGNYVFVGYSDSYSDSFDVWLGKVNPSDGSLIWNRNIGGPHQELGYSIFQDDEGRYIVAGYTTDPTHPGTDMLLYMIDSQTGNVLDSAVIHIDENDVVLDGEQAPDGTYVFAGYYSYPADIMVIKTMGTSSVVSEVEATQRTPMRMAPGGILVERDAELHIYTPSGKRVKEIRATAGQFVKLDAGMYIVRILTPENTFIQKITIR